MDLDIVGGPGHWTLVQALFGSSPEHRHVVTFKFLPRDKANRNVDAVELKLYIDSVGFDGAGGQCFVIEAHDAENHTPYRIQHFNIKDRTGGLSFADSRKTEPTWASVCPKCGGQAKQIDGRWMGQPVYECFECRTTCDWDEDCRGPLQFAHRDPRYPYREYVPISYCSPHNHD